MSTEPTNAVRPADLLRKATGSPLMVAAIFVFGLVARVGVIFHLSNFSTVDGFEAEKIALNMLAGKGFSMALFWGPVQPTSYNYPLYTFFVYLHFLLFGPKNYLPLELTQALIGSGSCVLLFYLGRALYDRATGLTAGFLCGAYPVYAYWTARAQALTIEVFLMIALLLALLAAMKLEKLRYWALAGALCGFCVLSKTLYLMFFPAYLAWAWIYGRARMARLVPRGAVFLAAAVVVIAPWTARNWITFHRFILVNSNSGFNLWIGNNPDATGSLFSADRVPMQYRADEKMRQKLGSAADADKDGIFRRRALEYMRAHPWRVLAMVPKRMYALWWYDQYMPSDYGRSREVVYVLLLVPTLLGVALSWKERRAVSIFFMLYLMMCLAYGVFYGSARFRYLIEFSFIIFSAHCFVVLFGRLVRKTAAESSAH